MCKIKQDTLPSVCHRHYSSFILGNAQEHRLREIKVVQRRVAPATCIAGQGIVWRAEVGGSDHNGAREAPPVVIHTPDLIARATAQAIVEKSSAQSSSVCSIPLAVEVPISTCPPCKKVHNPTNQSNGVTLRPAFHRKNGFFLLKISALNFCI